MRQEGTDRETPEGRVFILKGALTLILAIGLQGSSLAHGADKTSLADDLNGYAGFLGRSLKPEEISRLESALSSARLEVRALSAALLFRTNPKKYRADLARYFTVQDYEARATGRTETIPQDEFLARIKKLEGEFPGLAPPLMLVVSFLSFRDSNLWFRHEGQNISVARFFRGAFFAQAFKGTTTDPVVVANELDETARKEYERGVSRE